MNKKYYPWEGEFTSCNDKGCIAVVLLNIKYVPPDFIALYGSLKTENIGIEKIVANVISNPHIRYLFVCGDEIRGHCSGSSIIALNNNGIDKQNRIIDAPGAIPYIENLNSDAIKRFQNQIEIVNLIGVNDKSKIDTIIINYHKKVPLTFGDSFIAIKIKPITSTKLDDKRALHSKIVIDYLGKVVKRGD